MNLTVQVNETKIPGCYEILPKVFEDRRGSFIKTFHQDIFRQHQLKTHFAEEYYSISYRNVLRGLHFQLPPVEQAKIIYCVVGKVMDVVVDLRVGSPTYGQFNTFEVSAEKANVIYIPSGLAHGFWVSSEKAIMMYKVETVYSPQNDTGILWSSIDIPWPNQEPIMSERDSKFIPLSEFNSPFTY